MNLLYYIIGNNRQYYNQCYFSILSFLQFNEIDNIYIYTDAPLFFKKLEHRVHIIEMTEELTSDWRGKANFGWRIKIKAIEDMALKTTGLFIYVDTDTFLYRPLTPLIEGLKRGNAYMHEKDGQLRKMKHTPYKMWKQTRNKKFGGVLITDDFYMWNAGVVAMPTEKKLEAVQLALKICDDMCDAGVTRRLIEQFALSVALEETYGLSTADNAIGHYWGNKPEWDTFINDFFLQQYQENNSLEESVTQLQKLNLFALPYFKHVSSTKRMLNKLFDKLFPAKNERYLT